MSTDGRTGTLDRVLEAQGLSRRTAATVPHFPAVAFAVAETGLIRNLPVHFAERIAPLFNLDVDLPPDDPPTVEVMLHWHRRHGAETAHAWLRDTIIEAPAFNREA